MSGVWSTITSIATRHPLIASLLVAMIIVVASVIIMMIVRAVHGSPTQDKYVHPVPADIERGPWTHAVRFESTTVKLREVRVETYREGNVTREIRQEREFEGPAYALPQASNLLSSRQNHALPIGSSACAKCGYDTVPGASGLRYCSNSLCTDS